MHNQLLEAHMMKHLFLVLLSTFVLVGNIYATEAVTDDKISEITQRIDNYSTNQLIDRRDYLVSFNDESEDEDSSGVPAGSSAERAIEISIIEALLVALGAVVLDNVTEDSTTPPDTVFPVITILGDNPATVQLGDTYTDPGATSDGGETVSVSGTVDTNTLGSYTITYSATDTAGNTTTATRTVNVVDTTPPTITIAGDNPVNVELGGGAYVDAGASATDASGAVSVVTTGTVDTDTLGSYTITYTATDVNGNVGTATRTVNVVDTTPPVLTLIGSSTVTVELGDTYKDDGAAYTDLPNDPSTVTLTAVKDVDTDKLGSYSVTYTATDASDNVATVTRTVNVVDTTAPVITSSDTFVADENQTAIGTVTATDLQTVSFSVSGTELQITSGGVLTFVTAPDYETKSVYTATVTATDASSNSSTQDITVNVNDVGGIDDDPGTGTGTSTSTGTGTGTGTGT
ncbi:DUF5011 domain-containing protein [Pseudomonadota bacterium]|nr:DUF5011 domain-containing protein [Pseudomonadota bacterium]